MFIFLGWLFLSILVGVYAASKKTKLGGGWSFLISILFSPIVGFIVVLVSKPNEEKVILGGEMKKCPDCAELVKKEAIKCRYCGKVFEKEIETAVEILDKQNLQSNQIVQPAQELISKKKLTLWIIGIIIFIIFVFILHTLFDKPSN